MANRLTINYEKKPCYDIVFASDFSGLLEELQDFNIEERRTAIIADSNTVSLYGEIGRASCRERVYEAV